MSSVYSCDNGFSNLHFNKVWPSQNQLPTEIWKMNWAARNRDSLKSLCKICLLLHLFTRHSQSIEIFSTNQTKSVQSTCKLSTYALYIKYASHSINSPITHTALQNYTEIRYHKYHPHSLKKNWTIRIEIQFYPEGLGLKDLPASTCWTGMEK